MMKMKKLFMSFLLLFSLASCGSDSSNKTQYDVSNEHFTYNGFKTKIDQQEASGSDTPILFFSIAVSAMCEYDLEEVSMTVQFFNDGNILMDTLGVVSKEEVYANTEFTLSRTISSTLYTYTASVVATFEGKRAHDLSPISVEQYFTVTFVNNNSTANTTQTVRGGDRVTKPRNPTKTNYTFKSWCTDPSLNIEYNFYNTVASNFTLYAKYAVDYDTVANKINTGVIKSNVTVYTKSYNSFLGIFDTSSITFQGSGVLFYESTSYYYLLTNNHVTVKEPEYDKVSYTIEDYKGNSYSATAKEMIPEYDLAVLYFKKGKEDLEVAIRSASNPAIGDDIISIGQPESQKNFVSYGNILSYVTGPKLNGAEAYESNVTFSVIRHSAYVDHGSSGGALFDMNLRLVGINYAGATTQSGDFLYGLSIPITKVNEFLTKYIWD